MLYKSITITLGLFLALGLVSCSSYQSIERKPSPQIRIVDLDGNPRPVKNYVPEYNAKVLASQGVEIDDKTGDLTPIKNASKPASQSTATQVASAPKVESSPLVANTPPSAVSKQEPKAEVKTEDDVEYDLADESSDTTKTGKDKVDANKKTEEKNGKKFKVVTGKDKIAAPKESVNKTKSSHVKSGDKGLFIQVGSYSSERVAKDMLAKNSKISTGKIEEALVNNKKFYRVILGPAGNHKKAEDLLKKAVNSGHKDAFIIKDK